MHTTDRKTPTYKGRGHPFDDRSGNQLCSNPVDEGVPVAFAPSISACDELTASPAGKPRLQATPQPAAPVASAALSWLTAPQP